MCSYIFGMIASCLQISADLYIMKIFGPEFYRLNYILEYPSTIRAKNNIIFLEKTLK